MPTIDRVIPLLVCADIQAEHDFLVEAFGFEAGGVVHDDKGNAVHGEVHAGEATIWLHRVAAEYKLTNARSQAMQHGGLTVHVPDVDSHFAHAQSAGAEIDGPPTDQPYGQREYGARDPEGNRWWFATPLGNPA